MYYECGYQIVNGCEPDMVMRPIKLVHLGLSGALFITGEKDAVESAVQFLERELPFCESSAEEFALHFACEGLYGVNIVRLADKLMTA
ncbi:hypothetical protein SAMN02910447_00199 [Ruminococcus sp. YE71]|uniref:hypothetical protein n=1 Tax=unclassified Ruminococcus TaxID=2608920 RepID=UPI00088089B0|nr:MULTISPECIES: hypothetical protein [unclassified Ruminococcus]SDA09616.1 hypothetical protein SAMN02910446_00150 [Ruminococcus sp. YE78]SFW11775.1 hypothetical protein SAMN02910447_00199 [Ruminococcus sp. YE71]